MKISIIGVGVVGNAMLLSFQEKGFILNKDLYIYDKFKNLGTLDKCLNVDIIFLALPTPFNINKYDISSIEEICAYISDNNYNNIVVIKSTVEPFIIENLINKYKLKILHNPEFLSAKTAYDDFHNQKHIVIGHSTNDNSYIEILSNFYSNYYKSATISICSLNESSLMKLFCNSFYAVKIQFFTEMYLLCNNLNENFDKIKELMLKNNWINPMHTNIPGSDGNISYGGMCFPKDTNALNNFMIANNSPNKILNSTIEERNSMRKD